MTIDEAIKHMKKLAKCIECKYNYEQGDREQQKDAIEIAINALEKDMPQKPIFDSYHYAGYRCTNCNNTIPWGYKFCKHCGQALDWRVDC